MKQQRIPGSGQHPWAIRSRYPTGNYEKITELYHWYVPGKWADVYEGFLLLPGTNAA